MNTPIDINRRPPADAVAALLHRVGLTTDRAEGSALQGASMLEQCRASLSRAGINPAGRTPEEIYAAAFTQGVTDFPRLLESVTHRALLHGFTTAKHTWRRFCAVGQVSDFRDHTRIRMGSIGNLLPLNEMGEFKNVLIPDAERARVRAGTKGLILNISRKALINDDLNALTDLAVQLGAAAQRTLEGDVYAVLALNGGLGPFLDDGKTLFHASRGNYVTPGAAPTYESFIDALTKMASVKDVGGDDYLDLLPAIWLGPMTLSGAARGVNEAELVADPVTYLAKFNSFRNTLGDIVGTQRLSGTAWRMFAPIEDAPVLEVSFLAGNEEPAVTVQDGFDLDGVSFRVVFDYGVSALDWRGAFMNAGS